MSRYRPPPRPVSNYITAEGEKRLKQELQELWSVERPKVTQQVSEAAAMGDRSENAEYIYGKKRLREIDRRVRHLSKRLENLTVVKSIPGDTSKIYFGAWVELEDDTGKQFRYRLVGPDEINPSQGMISIDSPVGRSLLGKSLDSDVAIPGPDGEKHFNIVSIDYKQ
ncbi:MAG: transcription elongation factor GreB [Pseudohongiellaceae bacterium]